MTENPYRLARDIRGIGFRTADAIAMKLGMEKTATVPVVRLTEVFRQAARSRIVSAAHGIARDSARLLPHGGRAGASCGLETGAIARRFDLRDGRAILPGREEVLPWRR